MKSVWENPLHRYLGFLAIVCLLASFYIGPGVFCVWVLVFAFLQTREAIVAPKRRQIDTRSRPRRRRASRRAFRR